MVPSPTTLANNHPLFFLTKHNLSVHFLSVLSTCLVVQHSENSPSGPFKYQVPTTMFWSLWHDNTDVYKPWSSPTTWPSLDSHVFALGLWFWYMILILFTRLTWLSVLHWIYGLCYLGWLANEDIGLIYVIQIIYPSTHSIL